MHIVLLKVYTRSRLTPVASTPLLKKAAPDLHMHCEKVPKSTEKGLQYHGTGTFDLNGS